MKKLAAFSSMLGSVAFPIVSMVVPKVGFLALVALLATPGTGSSTLIGLFVAFFLSFFSAGGITPAELIVAF